MWGYENTRFPPSSSTVAITLKTKIFSNLWRKNGICFNFCIFWKNQLCYFNRTSRLTIAHFKKHIKVFSKLKYDPNISSWANWVLLFPLSWNDCPHAFRISTWAAVCATGVVSFETETAFIGDSRVDTGLSVNNTRFKKLNWCAIINPLAFKPRILYVLGGG